MNPEPVNANAIYYGDGIVGRVMPVCVVTPAQAGVYNILKIWIPAPVQDRGRLFLAL